MRGLLDMEGLWDLSKMIGSAAGGSLVAGLGGLGKYAMTGGDRQAMFDAYNFMADELQYVPEPESKAWDYVEPLIKVAEAADIPYRFVGDTAAKMNPESGAVAYTGASMVPYKAALTLGTRGLKGAKKLRDKRLKKLEEEGLLSLGGT